MTEEFFEDHSLPGHSDTSGGRRAPAQGEGVSKRKSFSRRTFLRRLAFAGAAGLGAGVLLPGCGGGAPESCDTSGLSEEAKQARQRYEYVSQTPYPEKRCDNCQFWEKPASDEFCGGCQLFGGPVHPEGYCNSWIAAGGG